MVTQKKSQSNIVYFIKNKYSMEKNNASLCKGDLHHNLMNFEIKISTGGKENNKFNLAFFY